MLPDNLCDFIKKIHEDPFQKISDLSVKDFYTLQEHVQTCDTCVKLVDEVIDRYNDIPPDPNVNDGRYN